MRRREFLTTSGAAVFSAAGLGSLAPAGDHAEEQNHHRTYASPAEAMKSPRETLMYVPAIRVGTASAKPDYLATVDVDPRSKGLKPCPPLTSGTSSFGSPS